MLLHRAVQRGLLGAVALIVDRGLPDMSYTMREIPGT
jgi:hypothetical protein